MAASDQGGEGALGALSAGDSGLRRGLRESQGEATIPQTKWGRDVRAVYIRVFQPNMFF